MLHMILVTFNRSRWSARVPATLALALLFLAQVTQAATFLVGTGSGCQFNTIQNGINAAAANPGLDTVRVANATTWGPTGITIGAQDVILDGRFGTCTDSVANGNYAQLVGNAVNPATRPAMVTITGSGVRRVLGFQIRDNVRDVGSQGGAIHYNGTGELILSELDIRNNNADFGGGIYSTGILTLAANVLIENNIAEFAGGGIWVGNGGTLYAVGNNLSIANNESYLHGGGLYLGNAQAFVASGGLGARAVLQSNRAAINFNNGSASDGHGAAVFVSAGVNPNTGGRLVLYSIDTNAPTRIADNRARNKGGAIYMEAGTFAGNIASVCILDSHLTGNRANGGAALYADVQDIAPHRLVINEPTRFACQVPGAAPIQPVRCLSNSNGCNVIEAHVTEQLNGSPTPGAVISLQQNASLETRRVILRGNTAGQLIAASDAGRVDLNTVLVTRNTTTDAPIRVGLAAANQGFVLRNATIASNTIGSGNPVILFDSTPSSVAFNNNLIFQPGRSAVVAPFPLADSGTYNWQHNATHGPQVLPNPSQRVLIDPRFENALFDDFRLRVGAESVNAFQVGSASRDATLDLDGRSRPIGLAIAPNDTSIDDLGAFERQVSDAWVVNGGFSNLLQLRYWEPSANGEAVPGVVWNVQDAVGNPDSGSALVNLPLSLAPRLTVLRRCFNVPGPGVYTINAKTLHGSDFNDDRALLAWRFRDDEPTCTSTNVQGAGESAFASGAGWRALAVPLQISVTSATTDTTIEVRLDAVSGLNLDGLTNVRFDDISITGVPLVPDPVFRDGFES